MFNFIRNILEKQIFGVSSWWANLLGIKVTLIRLFFIYSACTNAITILVYLSMIFLLRIGYHFKYRKRKSVFDL